MTVAEILGLIVAPFGAVIGWGIKTHTKVSNLEVKLTNTEKALEKIDHTMEKLDRRQEELIDFLIEHHRGRR